MQTDSWLQLFQTHSGDVRQIIDWGVKFFLSVFPFIFGIWFRWRLERWIERTSPLRSWERELGWLNLRAFRRAQLLWRGLGWFGYVILAGLLIVMAITFQAPARAWAERDDLAVALDQLPACLLFFGSGFVWLLFLGVDWWPRYRARREEALLRAYRLAHPSPERGGNAAKGASNDPSRGSRPAPAFSLLAPLNRPSVTERPHSR